ncbi:hypothetical protein ACFY2R_12660 [Micromonospora olivasterospora]|uniref:DUF4352 domain-containing protein n=1 Tax=Micromonospora olivasterospora TaxID=1880 RepID=A0A562IDB2_MICOL|nr:hypothetical protein [Micromonospora olivasterospora]TWH68788.1 hypothetical protein JD77_03786 [Micromonospora olivasterospora]
MPASTRHHRALAVFVHCLGVLAALPALPAAAPEAAARRPAQTAAATPAPAAATTPAAGPGTAVPAPAPPTATVSPRPAAATEEPTEEPSPSGSAVPTPAAPPPLVSPSVVVPTQGAPPTVTVAVTPASTPAPGYRIQVRNQGRLPVDTTVRQELPAETRATWITPGGRAGRTAGQSATTEITWQLKLPAGGSTTLHTALATAAPGRALSAPACAFSNDGSRAYDCATATWSRPTVPAAKVTGAAVWRRPPVLLGALALVLLLTVGGLWWWQRRRRRRAEILSAATAGAAARTEDPRTTGRGTLYDPRPATATAVTRRRRPPVWLVVAGAATLLAGVVFAAAVTATQRVAAIDTNKQPTSGAWLGQSATGVIGVPLRESAFEFTVYRVTCPPAGGGRQCQATIGVRNVTPQQQTWHGQMQRAYLPGGTWVSTDEAATRLANQGRDVFAQPLAAGTRMVLPLVFTVGGTAQPEQLELRSGVFSAGVRVDVP